jgi:hypothetical protein
MNHRSARFRPRLEALEERSLLSGVNFELDPWGEGSQHLTINASQSNGPHSITIVNHGNGHITGNLDGDEFNAGAGFINVLWLEIYGGPGGIQVNYSQQGEASNPSGDQVYAQGFDVDVHFAGGDNAFNATLNNHALRAGWLFFSVTGGGGNDSISINASGVDIAAGAKFTVLVDDRFTANTDTSFNMNWSGVKRGSLSVRAYMGTDAEDDLSLDATFLGARPLGALLGRAASGAAPGDLSLSGGDGDNSMAMLLSSPGGLSATGDVYAGSGTNSCFRTANVKDHGCQFDRVFGPPNRIGTHHVLPGF